MGLYSTVPHDRNDEHAAETASNAGLLGRRSCLKGLGGLVATAGVAGAASGTASAATTRRGIEFNRVVDVVDDLGLDPNGNEPVEKKLNNANQNGTLFVFPEGEYLVTDRVLMLFNDTVGMLGKGNARLKIAERFNDWAVIIDHGKRALFENIDIDLRADGATPGCRFGGYDDVQVHDVEYVGQGIHPNSDPRGEGSGNPSVNAALSLLARSSGSEVIVENVVARNRGLMGAYNHGNGRNGVWIGRSNKGTVTLRNCEFSGFPNNGLYTCRTPGVVQVEGGVFRNNDVSQVRLGSEGSYVKNALIEVDPSTSNSPNPEDMLNGRGVRIESGPIDTAGVTVENCDIRIAKNANSLGGVVVARPGGWFNVVDTRIKVDADNTHAILGRVPDGGRAYNTPPKPHRGKLVNVSVTGDARGGAAIEMRSRPESVVRSCCIEQRSGDRDGVRLVDSDGSVVRESTLNVTGKTVDSRRSQTKVWGNSTSGSCPLPASPDDSAPTSGTDGSDSTDSGSNDATSRKRIEFKGTDERAVKFHVEVSGEIYGTETSEDGEVTSNNTASGWVGGWNDAFTYTGHIVELVVQRDITLTYKRGSPSVLRFHENTTGEVLKYQAATSGSFWRTDTAEDKVWSTDDGGRVSGWVGGGQDAFNCNGELQSVQIDNVLSVSVSDGEE